MGYIALYSVHIPLRHEIKYGVNMLFAYNILLQIYTCKSHSFALIQATLEKT